MGGNNRFNVLEILRASREHFHDHEILSRRETDGHAVNSTNHGSGEKLVLDTRPRQHNIEREGAGQVQERHHARAPDERGIVETTTKAMLLQDARESLIRHRGGQTDRHVDIGRQAGGAVEDRRLRAKEVPRDSCGIERSAQIDKQVKNGRTHAPRGRDGISA